MSRRVLVISHNVFSRTGNMGKTLSGFFSEWDKDSLAQLYFHSEAPTNIICDNYFRITDVDIFKSLVGRGTIGQEFSKEDIDINRQDSRIDSGILNKVYQIGRKRTSCTYLFRDYIWKKKSWNSVKLNSWIDSFSPDIIFLASGDYGFIYEIALTISDERNIPLVISCYDDYYSNNKNGKTFLGRYRHKNYMKVVHRAMAKASLITAVSKKMAIDYTEFFHKPCHVLYTPSSKIELSSYKEGTKLSYIGNLGLKRDKQLIELGKALKKTNIKLQYIDVYSSETRLEILRELTEENGIRFHGQISADEVLEVMANSIAVIHTESFEKEIMERVRYSISTKIADSLGFGPCLIAYGPEGIASIDYLLENDAAYVISSEEDLIHGLQKILTNPDLRRQKIINARKLAKKNHDINVVPLKLNKWLQDVVDEHLLK